MVTPIKYIFYESLLNKDCNFGFCFDHKDHNKQRQHFACNYDVAQLMVYLRTLFDTFTQEPNLLCGI